LGCHGAMSGGRGQWQGFSRQDYWKCEKQESETVSPKDLGNSQMLRTLREGKYVLHVDIVYVCTGNTKNKPRNAETLCR